MLFSAVELQGWSHQETVLQHVLSLCLIVWCDLQDSPQEGVITRDIHRTFPAHDYFKDSDGDGQDSLYKICKVSSYTGGNLLIEQK